MRAKKHKGVYPRVLQQLEQSLAQGDSSGSRVVTAGMIAASKIANPHCKCEDLGLRPGLTHAQLTNLMAGCGNNGNCFALEKVRRLMGPGPELGEPPIDEIETHEAGYRPMTPASLV